MKIGVPAEVRPGETRVAVTPETVKKLVAGKHSVHRAVGRGVASASSPTRPTPPLAPRSASAAEALAPTWC